MMHFKQQLSCFFVLLLPVLFNTSCKNSSSSHTTIYPDAGKLSGPSSVSVGATITLLPTVLGGAWTVTNGCAMVNNGVITGLSPGTDTVVYSITNSTGTSNIMQQILVTLSDDDNGGYISDANTLLNTCIDVVSIADAAMTGSIVYFGSGGCDTVTIDSISVPHLLTISFATGGCTGIDGKIRSGKIYVTYNGHFFDLYASHYFTFSNYYLNGRRITGNKTSVNMGNSTIGQPWYSISVNDSIYLSPDSVITWVGNCSRTWISGFATPTPLDDVFSLQGTDTLTRANSRRVTFMMKPSTPLNWYWNCPWVESGKVDIYGSTLALGYTVNFGDTTSCDNIATLSLNGVNYLIRMH